MNMCQKIYAAYIESVCDKFNCSTAIPALKDGFRAFCESNDRKSLLEVNLLCGTSSDILNEERLWHQIAVAAHQYGLTKHYGASDDGWAGFIISAMEKNGVREVLDHMDKYFPEITRQIDAKYAELTHYGDIHLFKDVATDMFRTAMTAISEVTSELDRAGVVYKPLPTYSRNPISYYESLHYNIGPSYDTAIFYVDQNDSRDFARVSIVRGKRFPGVAGKKQPTEIRLTLPFYVAIDEENSKFINVPLIMNTYCGTVEPPDGYDGTEARHNLLGDIKLYNVSGDYRLFCRMGEYHPKDETTVQGFVDYIKSLVMSYKP